MQHSFNLAINCCLLPSAGLEDPDASIVCSSGGGGGGGASFGIAAVPAPPGSSQRLFCLPP